MSWFRSAWRFVTTGRRLHELPCPGCLVTNVVTSRVGDEIECGACGHHFKHAQFDGATMVRK